MCYYFMRYINIITNKLFYKINDIFFFLDLVSVLIQTILYSHLPVNNYHNSYSSIIIYIRPFITAYTYIIIISFIFKESSFPPYSFIFPGIAKLPFPFPGAYLHIMGTCLQWQILRGGQIRNYVYQSLRLTLGGTFLQTTFFFFCSLIF